MDEKWSISTFVLVLFMLSPLFLSKVFCDSKLSRLLVFPSSNVTEHTLPVFPVDPTPVPTYVGKHRPMAPEVDIYGTPLCVKNPGDTYCENVNKYPVNAIRSAIPYSKDEFQELFGTMMASARRMPGDIYEDPICPQYSRFFFPKAAVNENDQWAFVVNEVDDYVQAVMSELCEKEGVPCKYLDGALPFDHTSSCRQKYAYKRLLALHPNQKKTYTDSFKFPSCCVCYVKKPFVSSRKHEIPVDDAPTEKTKGKQLVIFREVQSSDKNISLLRLNAEEKQSDSKIETSMARQTQNSARKKDN